MSTMYSSGYSGFPLSSAPRMTGSRRGTSVYGGAGGRNVQVSYASNGLGSGFNMAGALGGGDGGGNNFSVSGSNKGTMQNLNDRLATYLEKVRSLESANSKLEIQIREWTNKHRPTARDYSKYVPVIEDLRRKISVAIQDTARLMLQIDNARLATEDFRIKLENEMALRMSLEADIAGLRKVLDERTAARSDLEMQVEGLKEELVYLKKNHEEEMADMRGQVNSSSVNEEVEAKPQADAKPQKDLATTMERMRAKCEGFSEKNRSEMKTWYEVKFDEVNKQVASSTETLRTSQSEINELKRTLQSLQIELQSQLSLKSALERDTESRYGLELGQLQTRINTLEEELKNMRMDIERQAADYKVLFGIKTRLELEIAEYRRLLDGEDKICYRFNFVLICSAAKSVFTQRTKIVTEEIVDGKVVSRTEE
ncbi:keratin, type I cytoskeletal 42-like [Anarhichas minor]|uniref:keratin, type I cytoskeletal 42-like n=1 Tax=Anarhichas minor TaxID=65739 RepID=UPI003F7324E0